MKASTAAIIHDLTIRYPALCGAEENITKATDAMIASYAAGGKLLVCGNGGSAADAQHIVGELMKDFAAPRELPPQMQEKIKAAAGEHGGYITDNLQGALPAIALGCEIALGTAYANDRAPDLAFAQQVYGLGNAGDILLGISTSGNSRNVIYAACTAKAKGLRVIALTGRGGGKLKDCCDYLIDVPGTETYKIQELHLPVYHTICLALENEFFGR